MGKFLNIVVLAVVMRRCGNSKISNYRQNFLATLLHNVPTLGEGGDFNHKCQCEERMLNIAQNCLRRTKPPLLPNVCYAFGLF